VRHGQGYLITPSGMPIDEMQAHSMVEMNMHCVSISARKPSSEWRFHQDIYQARPEVGAVIHTHSMFATTIACLRKNIPPFHYMIAVAGGDTIRCADYALFGTQALSDYAIEALKDRRACLLANHGMIAVGKTLQLAIDVAIEVETLCEQYWRALQIGEPHLLSTQEMQDVFEQFKGYGSWAK
jgi:L-fuculose-phosphate aldolase